MNSRTNLPPDQTRTDRRHGSPRRSAVIRSRAPGRSDSPTQRRLFFLDCLCLCCVFGCVGIPGSSQSSRVWRRQRRQQRQRTMVCKTAAHSRGGASVDESGNSRAAQRCARERNSSSQIHSVILMSDPFILMTKLHNSAFMFLLHPRVPLPAFISSLRHMQAPCRATLAPASGPRTWARTNASRRRRSRAKSRRWARRFPSFEAAARGIIDSH